MSYSRQTIKPYLGDINLNQLNLTIEKETRKKEKEKRTDLCLFGRFTDDVQVVDVDQIETTANSQRFGI